MISIIVVVYNMRREALRTLFTLSRGYQRGIEDIEYEIVIVENGSSEPLSSSEFEDLEGTFRYYYIDTKATSPAAAINFGVSKAYGSVIGVMIDGARMASPGIIGYAKMAFNAFKDPVVATLAWHLGPDLQNRSMTKGYNQKEEDELLQSCDWKNNGYSLFEISHLASSSENGYFRSISESNCVFLSRRNFINLGGFDEDFTSLGGGLVNLDFFKRACGIPSTDLVIILGEGTFHQFHNGVATNIPFGTNQDRRKNWMEEYIRLRGSRFSRPTKEHRYIGHIPREAHNTLIDSLGHL